MHSEQFRRVLLLDRQSGKFRRGHVFTSNEHRARILRPAESWLALFGASSVHLELLPHTFSIKVCIVLLGTIGADGEGLSLVNTDPPSPFGSL